jgi:hypothetical protein
MRFRGVPTSGAATSRLLVVWMFVIEKSSTRCCYRPSDRRLLLFFFIRTLGRYSPLSSSPQMSLTNSDFTDRLVSHTKSPCSWYSTGPHGLCLEDCENADPLDCVQQPTIVLMPYYNSDRPENQGSTVEGRTDLSNVRVRAVCLWYTPPICTDTNLDSPPSRSLKIKSVSTKGCPR